MLIKYINGEKNIKPIGNEKISKAAGAALKMETCGPVRSQRKVLRVCPAKRPPAAPLSRAPVRHRHALRLPPDGHDDAAMDPCDNSNDSGLGLEHSSTDLSISPMSSSSASLDDTNDSEDTQQRIKRSRLSVKCEQDDLDEPTNDKFGFSVSLRELKAGTTPSVSRLPLSGPVCSTTLDGSVTLSIVNQPEQQHRARYQTEGSRGAVKDRSGQGFPTVKLTGYNKPATLQVFIGSDVDRVSPHMFYQACKVCGKNSTPCTEEKSEGTIVIELQFEPSKNMIVTCDCVGILKERNVDVEHRFPEESVSRSKKKSTRCRMVFRTTVERPDGSIETLQVISQPIACTQLPGVPEINKRSLHSSLCAGGQELFILGKNFLKDSRVIFQQPFPSASKSSFVWEEEVLPDKEFLQPTHLVCTVPAFHRQDITEPVTVRLFVRSSGKCSESQTFQYLPNQKEPTSVGTNKMQQQMQQLQQKQNSVAGLPQSNVAERSVAPPLTEDRAVVPQILPSLLAGQGHQVKIPQTSNLMMIDATSSGDSVKTKSAVPELKQISAEHQQLLMDLLRQCLLEGNSMGSKLATYPVEADPPMLSKLLRQYVSENTGSPLPAQSGSSVEKFLSKIENGASMSDNKIKKINNNESYVSSTSLDFPQSKQHLPAMSNLTEAIQPQALGTNNATLQLKQGNLNSKNIENGLATNSIGNPIMPMQITFNSSKNTNFEANATITMQEVSTSITNQQESKVLVPPEIRQVMLTPSPQHTDAVVADPSNNATSILVNHEPVIEMLNTSPLMLHNVMNAASNSFESQANTVEINSQMLNQSMPCMTETLVQPLVMTTAMMEEGSNILSSSSTANGLLNSSLVDSQSQFQQADATLASATVNASLISMSAMPVSGLQSEISQSNTILPTLNQPEFVTEAHIINTQLGQLLTTDMVPEDHTSNHALTGDTGNSPLVRDVLLGSGVTSARLLSSSPSLSVHIERKKAVGPEGMLPQELTHMSEKDLLSYINPGCFDQVIP